jgi:hypothetical protein
MFGNFNGLGENTLGKIAEVALAHQLKADKLKVTVKTNPENLSKGILESLSIDGEGLIMSDNQRLQNLKMTFEQISVNPLQALVGKIRLTQPSHGRAFFVLSKKDLEQRLNALKSNNIKKINCCIATDGALTLNIVSQHQKDDLNVKVMPRLCQLNQRIWLEEITEHSTHALTLPEIILKEAEALFNLGSFQLKGISLKINSLAIANGNFTLQAVTEISHFPQGA